MRDFDLAKKARKENYYHLWFWDGNSPGVGSFRQKLFLLLVGVSRFWARLASWGHGDNCECRWIRVNSSRLNFCGISW